MDITSKLMVAYIGLLVERGVFDVQGYTGPVKACMLLDEVSARLADQAEPKQRIAIYALCDKVKEQLLSSGAPGQPG